MTERRRGTTGLALLLAIGMTASTLNVPIFSVLSRPLVDHFAISRSQLGLLIGTTTGTAALLSPLAGHVADRLGSRQIMTVLFAMAGMTVFAVAVAPTYAVLVLAAGVAGFANALGNPGANKLIATHLPPGQRGLVTGIKQSGVQFGVLLGGLAFPPLSTLHGWRTAVAAAAALPLVGMVASRFVLDPDPPRVRRQARAGRYRHEGATRWLACYALVMGAGSASVGSFVPLYAQEVLGLGIVAAGGAASAIGFAGVITRVLWGVTSERRRHFSGPLALLSALSMMAALLIWGSADGGVALFWAGIVLAGMSVAAWNSVANLAAMTGVEHDAIGRASGLVVGAFLAGFSVSPMLFGLAVDVTGSYDVGWIATIALFVVALAIALLWGARSRRSPRALS